MRVLTAIPVFNEEKYLARVVGEVRRYCEDILVVDDGSTDETPRILNDLENIVVLRHPGNRGYGQSLIDAFGHAYRHGYDWIITIDCDDQHEPHRIPAFIARAEQCDADIISGSRYLMTLPGNTPPPEDRREINQRITQLLNEKLGLSLTDAFCGFKAHRVNAMARLRLTEPGYAFPIQFWIQAAMHRLSICELAVPLIYNDPTRHFGGSLDDPRQRLAHYMDVFRAEFKGKRCEAGNRACCTQP